MVLNKEIFFKFTDPMISTELNTLNNKINQANYLVNEINDLRINNQLQNQYNQTKIKQIKGKFENNVCSNIPNAFWNTKQHIVKLPYIKYFSEKNIPSKLRAIHMSSKLQEHCKKEIKDLLDKKLIRSSKSPWSCQHFML